jgi:hypothetical protein
MDGTLPVLALLVCCSDFVLAFARDPDPAPPRPVSGSGLRYDAPFLLTMNAGGAVL